MKPVLLLTISALAVGCAWSVAPSAQARTAPPIHFVASVTPAPVHPGELATVTVRATVDSGWHVYSVVPTPEGPAATNVVSLGAWQAVGPSGEDQPIRKLDPNFGKEVGYHEGSASFTRAFRVPAGQTNALPTSVTLHYQTCNDKICLPPTDVSVPLTVSVTPGSVRPEYAQITSSVASAPSVPAAPSSGLALFLLAAIGAGLLAIVTPCVFPLIPITLTNFVKQANGSQAKLVRLSWGYALGIVALYVALGATCAALLGGRANNIAANPWVNLVEFVLFVVFALSFFETIQITLPANLGAMQQSARKHGGTAGLALLGVSFVLGSFTCTAPFIGTLLVSAAGGEWVRPLLGMLVFALAFASPFFVFAAFPQWIGRIPKGGVWLARFKATLGFIELAAALKFLSNADLVWQWKVLTQPVLLAAWALIFFCAALYLWGTLRFGIIAETEKPGARAPLSRKLVAGVFTLAALYCFWGLAGRPISPYIAAFLPPPGYGIAAVAETNDGLPWLSDYDTALAQAKSEGKPLLIDFTGYTCTNCRLNEKKVFPSSDVQSQFANYVRVQLYTDGGKDGAKNQKLQETKFGDVALPLYGVIDPKTETVIGKTAGVQSVGGFTDFLRQSNKGGAQEASAPLANTKAWDAYTPAAVTQATGQGRPVVVDFTAKWCVNCKAIEREVFKAPAVSQDLNRDFVTLRSDLTNWNAPDSMALQKKYGFSSLPTIIFLDKSGNEIKSLRITGRLSIADFQKRMQQASADTTHEPASQLSSALGI